MATGLHRRTGWLAAALVPVLLCGACSWGAQEPGLFTTPSSSSTPVAPGPSTPSEPRPGPDAARARLPVLADALWTTADGNDVTLRLAVHALRRTSGATVLDWSVTPLAGPGRPVGDLVPSGTGLGLDRTLAGEQSLALLDAATGRVLRPLADTSRQRFRRCLCTPLFVVTPQLRFGETKLLQLAFPALADATARVDVVLPNVAVVPGIPVTPVGLSPVVEEPVDLARPPGPGEVATGARTFTATDAGGSQQTVAVSRVVATRALTSVVWTLHSVDDQPGLGSDPGPPLSVPPPADVRVVTDNPASGPQLRVAGRRTTVGVRWTTASFAGRPAYECLYSGLGLWSRGLRHGGGSAQLATHVGPLPEGTRRVDVLLPGLPAFTDVGVTWRPDVAGRVQAVEPGTDATWTYDESAPPDGWSADQWPTPLPAPGQEGAYAGEPSRLLAALPGS